MPANAAILVADRSGSMSNILDNAVAGINEYISGIRKVADLTFTMLRFDTISTDVVHRRIPIADVPEITKTDLEPRGGTPLIDALCIAITSAKDHYKDDDRVVIVANTDGFENASREYKLDDLHALIKERRAVGWQFVFLGASIDAYRDATKFGINTGSTMSYDAKNRGATLRASSGLSGQSMSYYSTGADINFSDEDKRAAGDAFIPADKPGTKTAKSLIDRVKL